MRAATDLPGIEAFKRALGDYISPNTPSVLRFPRPHGNPKTCCCTLKLDSAAPDGFVVSDASERTDDLELKDYVRERVGLPPFSRALHGRSNGVAKNHRPAGGSIAHDHPTRETPSRIHLLSFNEIRLGKQRRYLVPDHIPRVGLVVLWGPPKCGKSFWATKLAMHVALGWEWHGRRVQQGAVVYCALEGQAGLEARIEAFRHKNMSESYASDEVHFYLMPVTINLVAEQEALIAAIRKKLGNVNPALVVIDTLNRSLQGSESSDLDMSNYVKAADAVRDAFECAIVVVHHSGHEANRPRGHTSLVGAADAVIAVKKEPGTSIVITTVEMMKDGEPGSILANRLERVEVGTDEDGEEITSCILKPIEGGVPEKANKTPKLSAGAKITLDALKEALATAGSVPPSSNHIPENTPTVSLNLWRRHFYQRDPDSNAEARKKAFQRHRQALQQRGMVDVWGSENSGEEEFQCWLIT